MTREERWVRCPACQGEGRTLHTSLEIDEVCPRCAGVGEELADCVPDPDPYAESDRLHALQAQLARQIVYHLQLGYGITVAPEQAMDVAAQQCAAVTEWMLQRREDRRC